MGMLTGCAKITNDVSVNNDLTGVWKSKVFLMDQSIKKEVIEQEIKKAGVKNYTMKDIVEKMAVNGAGDKGDVKGWEIEMPWKNNEELKSILVLGRVATFGGNQGGAVAIPDPITKDEKTGLVTLNLGNSADKMTLHVDGTFDKEAIKTGKVIDDKTIEFKTNDVVKLQYKPTPVAIGSFGSSWMGIAAAVVIIGAGGLVYYRRKEGDKKAS